MGAEVEGCASTLRVLYFRVIKARAVRAIGLAWAAAAACALLVGACTYDFGKFSASGEQSGGNADSASGGEGAVGVDTGPPSDEAGGDVMPEDTGLDVATDTTESSAPDATDTGLVGFTVGGTVSTLVGHGLQLMNTGDVLTLASGATTFTFPAQTSGSAYAVSVSTEPTAPAQTCAVMNASGTIASANVTNVKVTCTPTCAPGCNDGQMCVDGTDCGSGSCQGGTCQSPACAPTCPDGNGCGGNADCGSGVCIGSQCKPPSCSPSCNDGNACGANADCASLVCTAANCQPPACAPNCMPGSPCGANGDCKSGVCKGNHTCR